MFSAWNFLKHFPSLGRCCFPWVCFHSEWKTYPQESRLPETVKYSLWAQSCLGAFENGYCLCVRFRGGPWVSVNSVLHDSGDLRHKTLWAINTVSSLIQASCIYHPCPSSPTSLLPWLLMGSWGTSRGREPAADTAKLSRPVSILLSSHSLKKNEGLSSHPG